MSGGAARARATQSDRSSRRGGDAVIRVLFLAANPSDTNPLRLDEEVREIDRVLRMARFRDMFDIRQHWAVRAGDLQELLLREQPDIVHFSGHGSAATEIILEGTDGRSHAVPARALERLFAVLRGNIRCVVLNACYSEGQARAIGNHIDCVVGMAKAVGDRAAVEFASAFYQALGYGRDVKTAFDLGCNAIDLHAIDEQDTPRLIANRVNPAEVVFVRGGRAVGPPDPGVRDRFAPVSEVDDGAAPPVPAVQQAASPRAGRRDRPSAPVRNSTKEVREVISDLTGTAGRDIPMDVVLSDLGIDSLDMVELALGLEERLGVVVDDDDLCRFGGMSVRDIVHWLGG